MDLEGRPSLGLLIQCIKLALTFTKPARQCQQPIPADIRQRLLSNVWCGHCRHDPLQDQALINGQEGFRPGKHNIYQ